MGGRRWRVEAAGVPCMIERSSTTGDWVVTLASTTVGRAESLPIAIVRAGGGLVTPSEAEALAISIVRSHAQRQGSSGRRG
jgi:hypothetical protein